MTLTWKNNISKNNGRIFSINKILSISTEQKLTHDPNNKNCLNSDLNAKECIFTAIR